jgi:hypothetical protein
MGGIMRRTFFLALTVVALASFATAVQADLIGKGKEGEKCHAQEVWKDKEMANTPAHTDHCYKGAYKYIFDKLHCGCPGGSINCRKDDTTKPPKSTCWDGAE